MNILISLESLEEKLIPRHMREYSELNLRIVGREQNEAVLRHKGFSYLLSLFPSYRNVLQIRVRAAQPSCRNDHLIERRVNASCLVVNERRQHIYICIFQLAQRAALEYFRRKRVKRSKCLQDCG